VGLLGEGGGVAVAEVGAHGVASGGALGADPAPGLAVADGGGELGDVEKLVDEGLWDGVGFEAPDVAPPGHEIRELRAEFFVEDWGPWLWGRMLAHAGCNGVNF
jgi:hypothetical protein